MKDADRLACPLEITIIAAVDLLLFE